MFTDLTHCLFYSLSSYAFLSSDFLTHLFSGVYVCSIVCPCMSGFMFIFLLVCLGLCAHYFEFNWVSVWVCACVCVTAQLVSDRSSLVSASIPGQPQLQRSLLPLLVLHALFMLICLHLRLS